MRTVALFALASLLFGCGSGDTALSPQEKDAFRGRRPTGDYVGDARRAYAAAHPGAGHPVPPGGPPAERTGP